jgi:peptidyl-prolyl cis-trans isomerase A (cyclophilin A)
MRKYLASLLCCLAIPVAAQTATTHHRTSTASKATAKPAAKPATTTAHPTAIIETTAGNMTCTLFPDKAPIGVSNFIGLAKGTKDWKSPATGRMIHGQPLYNGTIFHRVIPQFMIQGGSPSGQGDGDPGYAFKNETSPDLTFDRPGRLAYANAGPNTNGSQFFITEVPYPSLDGNYTVFGQCDDASVELVKKIARMPRNADDRPNNPVKINKIAILGSRAGTVHHTTTTHKPMPAPKPAPQPTKQQ